MAQQELAEPVAGPQLIALGCEPSPHQVPQRLMRRVRHPHRRQIPRSVAARQLLRIAPVRLDPVPGLHRHQGRGDYLALHPQLAQLPIQHVTAGRTEERDEPSRRNDPPLNHVRDVMSVPRSCPSFGTKILFLSWT